MGVFEPKVPKKPVGVWRSADHPVLLNLETNDAVSDFLGNGDDAKHLEFVKKHKSKAKGKKEKASVNPQIHQRKDRSKGVPKLHAATQASKTKAKGHSQPF